jgi:membrane associated rhomboid family serine protease
MSQPDPSSPATGVPTCYRHPGRETYIRCQRCDRPICPDCMRDAAVGFQCPSCVAEGAKTTRSGRTAYGGLRSGNPGLTTIVLIGLNALVFLAVNATGGDRSILVRALALWRQDVVLNYPDGIPRQVYGVDDGAYWQLLTAAFMHEQIFHIAFNMLALWVLGPQLEAVLGRVRFLVLYVGSALAASALVYWFAPINGYTLGASGAVFGLLGALLVTAYKVGGDVRGILTWLGINVVITFAFPNISWQGHLGGFVGGVLIGAVLVYAPRERRTLVQALGVGAVLMMVLAAVVARSAMLA